MTAKMFAVVFCLQFLVTSHEICRLMALRRWWIYSNNTYRLRLLSCAYWYKLNCPVLRWRYAYSVWLVSKRSQVRLPSGTACTTTLGKLFTSMCLCHQTVSAGTRGR